MKPSKEQAKQAKQETEISREEITRRQQIADAILLKMSYGTYKFRQNLLTWLKEAQRVTGFDLNTLKKMGLIRETEINGKIGAETKALRKANLPIFEQLVAVPADELTRCYEIMSAANIQRRYGRKVEDRDIGVPIKLKFERPVEVGTKRQVAGWLRSKQNERTREELREGRDRIKAKQRRKHAPVRHKTADYVKSLRKFGAYVESGLNERRKWMNEVEERTHLVQKMSNLA